MADDGTAFDPNMKKKKKKVKKMFDENADDNNQEKDAPTETIQDKEDKDDIDDLNVDDFDFANMKKKKKSKSKKIDLSELKDAIDEPADNDRKADENPSEDTAEAVDSLDIDFKQAKKKKKKTRKIEDIVADKPVEDEEDPNSSAWVDSDRDYTYDEMLQRIYDTMREKNPELVAGEKKKLIMKPPQVMRVGTKKTSFANFTEICKLLHRQPKHLLAFLLAELGTSGSIDGNNQLIIKGRFQPKQIENVLRSYIKEYVTCHTCRSHDTILQKDTRLFFLQCETCGSRCSVATIKSGFQAVTGKRAAIRAKTA